MNEPETRPDDGPGLPEGLRDRVLRRLGLTRSPSPDLEGLGELYRAWCSHVPFDNVRKVIALADGRELPGRSAGDFFDAWLEWGAGGTCWPGSNALYELMRSLGFNVSRGVGSVRDSGALNHATNRVRLEGRTWLVDSSMLTIVPLPLSNEIHIGPDFFSAEVEPEADTHVIWVDFPPQPSPIPCRLQPEPISLAFHLESYERSREKSAFNRRLYARRNHPGEKRVVVGNKRVSKTASGVDVRELAREELCLALRDDIGIHEDLIEEWVSCGGLELAFEEPPPPPPPVERQPPSQRR